MYPAKAPDPDGMSLMFFQKFWNITRYDVVNSVLNILNHGHDPTSLNHTHIVLIPKVKHPKTTKDYRPISLYNVIFRIITETIANHLKLILPEVISMSQSAFIPGHLITNNCMVAFENFPSMKKKKGRQGHKALKLDMSIAYDKVEWSFLNVMLCKLGFDSTWIDLVM